MPAQAGELVNQNPRQGLCIDMAGFGAARQVDVQELVRLLAA
jgi:hypothetical protein